MGTGTKITTRLQVGLGILCLVLFLLLLGGAWSLPFLYPSSSIFYKFGPQRLLLNSGKLVGLTGGLLLLIQLVSVSHLPLFERIFSRSGLLRFHRLNGLFLLLLLSHPLLILAADNFAFYPPEKKYLPEFVGVALLLCLFLLVIFAWFRTSLSFSYRVWRVGHRLGALLVIVLFTVHLLTVSETFRAGLPHNLALALVGIEGFLLLRIFGRALFTESSGGN